jgi:hypothetical protein
MMNLCLNSCHSNGGEVAKGAALARQPSFRARRSKEILVENEADCVEQSEAEKSLCHMENRFMILKIKNPLYAPPCLLAFGCS